MSKRDDIANHLMEAIRRGEIVDALPSENVLATQFSVSRLTVRAALEQLANDGKVQSRQGKGWFVHPDNRLAFPLLHLDQGRKVGTKDVWNSWLASEKLIGDATLEVSWATPPRHVQQHLELPNGERCIARRRVRRVDDRPVMISTGYFPAWVATGTNIEICGTGVAVDLQSPSPLGILREIGHAPVRDLDLIGTRRPTREEQRVLMLERGIPVLTNCRTSYDSAGRPVRCTADMLAGDRFYLTVDQHHGTPEEKA